MIKMVNTTEGKLILYCAYLPPYEGHNMRIKELIDKLLLLKRRYKSLYLILFCDLHIDRKNIKEKLCNKIEQFGFNVIFMRHYPIKEFNFRFDPILNSFNMRCNMSIMPKISGSIIVLFISVNRILVI